MRPSSIVQSSFIIQSSSNVQPFYFVEPFYFRAFLLADLGKARGCSTNTVVIDSLGDSSFVKISLRCRPGHTIKMEIHNLKGRQSCFIGSKVTAILTIDGLATGRLLYCAALLYYSALALALALATLFTLGFPD